MEDGQIGIDVCHGAADGGLDILLRSGELDDNRADVHRTLFRGDRLRIGVGCVLLGERAEKQGSDFAAGIGHFEVREDADDFKRSGVFRRHDAEALPDGVLVGEEVACKGLIDECNRG